MVNSPNGMEDGLRGVRWIVAALIILGGVIPPIIYVAGFGRLPTVTPEDARFMLQEGRPVQLVDVRPRKIYMARHLDGAANWPLDAILATKRNENIPLYDRSQALFLICDVGWDSRKAVEHLSQLGHPRVYQVRGGIQEWTHSFSVDCLLLAKPLSDGASPTSPADLTTVVAPQGKMYDRFRVASGGIEELPFRQSPAVEQALAVVAFFFFKPIYELLSLVLIIVLWKSREPDLAALRWGMIFFFLGENACAVNYFAFRESSYIAEYLHSYGMALSFGFITYAFLEGIDRRVLFLSDNRQRCSAIALCGSCAKHVDAACGLKRLFYVLIPALMIVALMLPTVDWQNTAYNTGVFGRLYSYGHLWIYQVFENWYCAAAAFVMLGASLAVLIAKKENAIAWAKIAFAAGVGPLGFGMLRMIIGSAYDGNRVWYLFWEETTELLLIAGICCLLWIFRRTLLAAEREPAKESQPCAVASATS
jgi:rhodanese-related sulfurtransferase